MSFSVVFYVIGTALMIEGALMALPFLFALAYGESLIPFAVTIVLCFAAGFPAYRAKPETSNLLSKEGVVSTGLVWIILSVFGMLPFLFSGAIPDVADAFFETVSGFTTTGSTILPDVEALPRSILLWRSLMHWIGGMGILVFMLALLPLSGGTQMNLMKAESPGPSISKLVPRAQDTAKILYGIYIIMTLATIFALWLAKMPVFDAICIGLGAAGTGGFSVLNDGCASYTILQQAIITVAMALFGINFNFYFLILFKKNIREAFKIEEVKTYLLILLGAAVLIAASLYFNAITDSPLLALHQALFHASSVMTTTGYATMDMNFWPGFAQVIIVFLMIIGACAGSTGGGLKVSRVLILAKSFGRECQKILHPAAVKRVHMDGKTVEENVIYSTGVYFFIYVVIILGSILLVSLDGFGWEETVSSVIATFNNIGPGFGIVGSMGSFACMSTFSKLVLSADMLIGRLEIFPILLLFSRRTWRKF